MQKFPNFLSMAYSSCHDGKSMLPSKCQCGYEKGCFQLNMREGIEYPDLWYCGGISFSASASMFR
jgi:hypothetical protein